MPRPVSRVVDGPAEGFGPEGRDLEPAVWALGRWGTTRLGEPRPGEIVTASAVVMALRAVFDSDRAAGPTATWEIHAGDLPSSVALMQAAKCGLVELDGSRELLDTFIRVFPSGRPAIDR